MFEAALFIAGIIIGARISRSAAQRELDFIDRMRSE